MDAKQITDSILAQKGGDRRPSEVFAGLTGLLTGLPEVRKIGGFTFLRPTERKARDRRRAIKRRQDPQAARQKRLTFRKNRQKIKLGKKKFLRSSKGKRFTKILARRRKVGEWVANFAPGRIQLGEDRLDLTPFEELKIVADRVVQSPTMLRMVKEYLIDLSHLVEEYPEFMDDLEIQEYYDAVAEFVEERMDGAPSEISLAPRDEAVHEQFLSQARAHARAFYEVA